ncbi:hypothetical protein H5410_011221 [Solanum commersonii]|uniref:Uncharacterized protein n=1 Tax=Solanum commersonii TaxID=4109 RepID=A0A9J6AP14_SOLCO|nr:hypothetical protein H5410_011221 [Solanum commersonii]
MIYEHENIVADDIDQQMAQSNNVDSSSRSHDREMQVQREEIWRFLLKPLLPTTKSRCVGERVFFLC